MAEQLYQDPDKVTFNNKPIPFQVADIDDGAYNDPDKEGFHVRPPLSVSASQQIMPRSPIVNHGGNGDDDADDLYQDPEEIDFRHPISTASSGVNPRNDRNKVDYDSPDDRDDYCEPPPDARLPVVPTHRPLSRGILLFISSLLCLNELFRNSFSCLLE